MLISRNWLRDFVDLPADLDPKALVDRITITTAEVEGMEHVTALPPDVRLPAGAALDPAERDDWIIEIDNKSITHRPDLWGHYGMAREVAAILNRALRPLPLADDAALSRDALPPIPIEIDDPAKCPRYSALRFKALGSLASPPAMQVRLARVGMRPISFLVDLTNYVMAELGQPMHAFDAATMERIEVGTAAPGEKFRTLDGVERVLPSGTLMILRGRRSVAIAGIMGGAETEVTAATREILLESANFDPATIRRAAAAMAHRTEASARFEKSLDPQLTLSAIRRLVLLAQKVHPSLEITSRLSDCFPAPKTGAPIALDPRRVSRIIGHDIPRERIIAILRPLEFRIDPRGDVLEVTPPSFRATKDIAIAEDLIEEVARFVGYDHIEPVLPRIVARPLELSADLRVERATLEHFCLGGPFIEVHDYIWHDDTWLTRLGHDAGPCITLKNPVAPNTAKLRRHLLPGLLAHVELNRRRLANFALAEIGSVFQAGQDDVVTAQSRHLALALVRTGKGADDDAWRAIKSHAEGWATQVLRGNATWAECAPAAPWEDSQRLCELRLNGRAIGRAGLAPMALKLKIDERLRTVAVAWLEVDLTGLDPEAAAAAKLPPPPAHPEVHLDFSFVSDSKRRYAALAESLGGFKHPLLARLHFVDSYEGAGVGDGKRSLTIRAVVGDPARTLADVDLSDFRDRFSAFLRSLNVELRG